MWQILLLILKFIGIALLMILGIIILLVCAVLLVPVRYHADIQKLPDDANEKNKKQFFIKIHFSWLMHILYVPVFYENQETQAKIKLFGITVKDLMKKQEKPVAVKKKKAEKKQKERLKKRDNKVVETELPKTKQPEKVQQDKEQPQEKSRIFERKHVSEEDASLSFFKRIFLRLLEKIRKLKETVLQFCVKIKQTIKKVLKSGKQIWVFIKEDSTKQALLSCKTEVILLLKKISPRNVRGWIRFGLDDPASTGRLLGAISIIYGKLPSKLNIYPDFENQILEGKLHIKGHIHLVTLVGILWRLWGDQNIKSAYQAIKDGVLLKEESA